MKLSIFYNFLIFFVIVYCSISLIEAQYEGRQFNYPPGETCAEQNHGKNSKVFLKITFDQIVGQSVNIKILRVESNFFSRDRKEVYSQNDLSYAKDFVIKFENGDTGSFLVCFNIIVHEGYEGEPQPIFWRIIKNEKELKKTEKENKNIPFAVTRKTKKNQVVHPSATNMPVNSNVHQSVGIYESIDTSVKSKSVLDLEKDFAEYTIVD